MQTNIDFIIVLKIPEDRNFIGQEWDKLSISKHSKLKRYQII